MAFQIIRDDITKVKSDVLVEMAASDNAAGEVEFMRASFFHKKHRIRLGIPVERDENGLRHLRQCYDKALRLAVEHGCKTIAFPWAAESISSAFGFQAEQGMQAVTASFMEFLKENEIDIILVVASNDTRKVSGRLFEEIRSYLAHRKTKNITIESAAETDEAAETDNVAEIDEAAERDDAEEAQIYNILLDVPQRKARRRMYSEEQESRPSPMAMARKKPGAAPQKKPGAIPEMQMLQAKPGEMPQMKPGMAPQPEIRQISPKTELQPGMPQISPQASPQPEASQVKPGASQPGMLQVKPGVSQPGMPQIKPGMAQRSVPGAIPKAAHSLRRNAASVLEEFSDRWQVSDKSLENRLKQMYTDSFEKHLQQLINKKGMKNSEVYTAANISKQYFSRLMKGQVKPSKEKVLALAVGLRLNMDETVDFLRVAGYALSPVSQTDVIVEYFIQKQDYNVIKIDFVLFDYGLPTLSEPRSTAS